MIKKKILLVLVLINIGILGCASESNSGAEEVDEGVDITDAVFTEHSSDCATYVEEYISFVKDIQNNSDFSGSVIVTSDQTQCTITVNGIPNHDFNDVTARFATPVSEVSRVFTVSREVSLQAQSTNLSQQYWDAIM